MILKKKVLSAQQSESCEYPSIPLLRQSSEGLSMDISQFNMRGIICQCEAVGDIMWCVCALDFFLLMKTLISWGTAIMQSIEEKLQKYG